MPQPFNHAVITNGGASLLAMAQAGKIKIRFTRMAVGNGIYTDGEKSLSALQAASSLKAEKNSYKLSETAVVSGHSVKLTALITNQDPVTSGSLIDEGYYINEIGVFARPDTDGGEEVLYSIVVTAGEHGDFMPPYNGYHPAQIIQDYYVTVDNSAEVIIQSELGTVALARDLEELSQRLDHEVSETGRRFEQIMGLINEMCNVGTEDDIKNIVDGNFVDGDEEVGSFLEIGTVQDVQDIINDNFNETEDSGTQVEPEQKIIEMVNNAFKEET